MAAPSCGVVGFGRWGGGRCQIADEMSRRLERAHEVVGAVCRLIEPPPKAVEASTGIGSNVVVWSASRACGPADVDGRGTTHTYTSNPSIDWRAFIFPGPARIGIGRWMGRTFCLGLASCVAYVNYSNVRSSFDRVLD